MASGGDNYSVLRLGVDRQDVGVDVDALEAYLASGRMEPVGGRVTKAAVPVKTP